MIKYTINGQDYDSYIFEPLKVGQSHLITVTMENNYKYNVTLNEAYSEDPELIIKTFTENLVPAQRGEIVFEFRPSIERPEPCDCHWGFRRVVIG